MGKAAKKPAKRAQVDEAAAKSGGSIEPSADGEDPARLVPVPRSAVNLRPQDAADHARVQQFFDNAARVARFLERLLNDGKKHVQVIAWITWLALLGVPTAMVLVPLFLWDPWQVIWYYAGGGGLAAVGNLVVRRLLRKSR